MIDGDDPKVELFSELGTEIIRYSLGGTTKLHIHTKYPEYIKLLCSVIGDIVDWKLELLPDV